MILQTPGVSDVAIGRDPGVGQEVSVSAGLWVGFFPKSISPPRLGYSCHPSAVARVHLTCAKRTSYKMTSYL